MRMKFKVVYCDIFIIMYLYSSSSALIAICLCRKKKKKQHPHLPRGCCNMSQFGHVSSVITQNNYNFNLLNTKFKFQSPLSFSATLSTTLKFNNSVSRSTKFTRTRLLKVLCSIFVYQFSFLFL